MNIISALEQSCDVYFYEIALKTGIQKIRDMALRLGLGALTGIDLPDEKGGIIPSHEWKLATKGVVWTPGETVVASIGQGYVLTTPMQLAVMTARIANGKTLWCHPCCQSLMVRGRTLRHLISLIRPLM